jgi:hypothetical protein
MILQAVDVPELHPGYRKSATDLSQRVRNVLMHSPD